MSGRDIVDDIDALIDSQLDAGEPIGGYDYNDPDYPKCGHCQGDWHGLAITERMVQMRLRGEMETDYRYADDTSRVVCPGSEFIGPLPKPEPIDGCGCIGCRTTRSLRAVRAAREGGLAPRWNYPTEGFFPSPLYPSEMQWPEPDVLDPRAWFEPARWWRLDVAAYRHRNLRADFADDRDDQTDITHRRRGASRRLLTMLIDSGFQEYRGLTILEPDNDADATYAFTRYDEDGLISLDIRTRQPNDMRGRIVWHEIDGPGGDYVHSRAVVSASRLNQWFDDHGLWFLAPREFRTAVDRLLDTVDFVPWQRNFLNRAVNAIRRGDNAPIRDCAPYLPAGVTMPQRGDIVGYEIGGRVYTGYVTGVEPQPHGDDTVLRLDGSSTEEFAITLNDPDPSIRRLFGLASDGEL
ncbi:hypothetical protein SEA_HITTER_72 [Gordonia phage Hitter]|nr:hypothetical protein SEA_HITTER_72 [Gordonia phage Hitter]